MGSFSLFRRFLSFKLNFTHFAWFSRIFFHINIYASIVKFLIFTHFLVQRKNLFNIVFHHFQCPFLLRHSSFIVHFLRLIHTLSLFSWIKTTKICKENQMLSFDSQSWNPYYPEKLGRGIYEIPKIKQSFEKCFSHSHKRRIKAIPDI